MTVQRATGSLGGVRILVVEDEPTIATAIARRLTAEGAKSEVVFNGLDALDRAATAQPDLVVLDVMLPGLDGLEVCRRIQAARPVPVLMLTARDDEIDKLIGLGVGADDYMTKPFSMRELVARIKALLRRVERAKVLSKRFTDSASLMVLGDVEIDRKQRRVRRLGQAIHLTPTEFDLLVYFASKPRQVLSRETLLEQVWDWTDSSVTRTVDSHVKAVRRKLGADLIRTVHGIGYAFEPVADGPDEDDMRPAQSVN
ncbi:MAG: response regulator transcription factor [Bifidobacteriaceae bacterium]|jgi:DNA-binding response OmpR family regulator|nr:response regulator transcription factor [Bifidobacteriaceae bacterium]